MIRVRLGVGLGERQDGQVMAVRPPFDESPAQSLQLADYIVLAVRRGRASGGRVDHVSLVVAHRESVARCALSRPARDPGFRVAGIPAAGERPHKGEQLLLLVTHAAMLATSTHGTAWSTCPVVGDSEGGFGDTSRREVLVRQGAAHDPTALR